MMNKSYAINMSLLRIGVLAAQIAVSPSAAAQWRDFLVDEGGRLAVIMITWQDEARNGQGTGRNQIDSPPRAMKSSRGALEDSKWEMQ